MIWLFLGVWLLAGVALAPIIGDMMRDHDFPDLGE